MGAVSFFSGVSRITVSLTVIMLEITGNLQFLLPIMVTCMTAKFVGDMFNLPLYELLIGNQHIPFLETDAAPLYEHLRAKDVMSGRIVTIPMIVTVKQVVQLLVEYRHNGFPVEDEAPPFRYRGLILRSQLTVLLRNQVWKQTVRFTNQEFQWSMMNSNSDGDLDDIDVAMEDMDATIDLAPYVTFHKPRAFPV
jgi:hypothetical protein